MKTSSKFGPREYIFIGMLFVIPVVMSMCVLSPRSKANAQMRDDSAVKRRQLGEFTLIRERAMQQVNDNIVELEKAVLHLQDRVPKLANIEKTIGDLSQMARANSMRTKNIRAMPAEAQRKPVGPTLLTAQKNVRKPEKEYKHRDLTMEVKGTFPNFYSFLQAVENYPRIIHVDRVRLLKTETQGYVKAKLRLRIFFQQEQEQKQEQKS